jgi:hypothetical protein
MEVSQLLDPAALTPLRNEYVTGWVPVLVWMMSRVWGYANVDFRTNSSPLDTH